MSNSVDFTTIIDTRNKSKKPFLSIVVPTYNRRDLLVRALQSVRNQSAYPFAHEIIVCDDASTDDTQSLFVSKKFVQEQFGPVLFIRKKENGGVNKARNCALSCIRGSYVLFLDSDDRLTSDVFEYLATKLKSLSKVNLFLTADENNLEYIMTTIAYEGTYTYAQWLAGKEIGGEFLSVVAAGVFKKDLFDEERFCFESFFWNRIIKKYGAFAAPKVLRLYSFSGDDRLSRKLVRVEFAQRRFADYKNYLSTFSADYLAAKLPRHLALLYAKTSLFGLLGDQKKEARTILNKSLSTHITLFGVCMWFYFILPQTIARRLYVAVARILRIS